MENYMELGHPYINSYSLSPTFMWVLSMSPFMCNIFSKAEYIEADVTFRASVKLDYLLNIITFDYESLKCKELDNFRRKCFTFRSSIWQGW